jgi:basic membrane lipoprotein Med (substrate-binding protein (PBP1-ABC) superfamily)
MAGVRSTLVNITRRRWAWPAIAGGAVLVALVIWAVLPSSPPAPAAPRARQYVDFDACLLTDSGGIGSPAAASAWAGLQDVSAATSVRVSFLPVVGPQTEANAVPYLGSLIARHCRVIVAVGLAPVAAVSAEAAKYPTVPMVVVAADPSARPSPRTQPGPVVSERPRNLTVVDVAEARTGVAAAVVRVAPTR